MSYPVVKKATFSPARCVVSGDIDGPFFDLGTVRAINPRLYVHVPVIEACAKQLGMVPVAEVEALKTQLAEVESRYAALDRYREAVETVEVTEKEIA